MNFGHHLGLARFFGKQLVGIGNMSKVNQTIQCDLIRVLVEYKLKDSASVVMIYSCKVLLGSECQCWSPTYTGRMSEK